MFLKKYLGAHKLAIFLCSVLFVFQAVFSLSVPYFMGEMIEVKLFRLEFHAVLVVHSFSRLDAHENFLRFRVLAR